MRDYSWQHPCGSYIQERWFDLGNVGLVIRTPKRPKSNKKSASASQKVKKPKPRVEPTPADLRRLDAVLEPTKRKVLDEKKWADDAGIENQAPILEDAAGQSFYNTSPFGLKDLPIRP